MRKRIRARRALQPKRLKQHTFAHTRNCTTACHDTERRQKRELSWRLQLICWHGDKNVIDDVTSPAEPGTKGTGDDKYMYDGRRARPGVGETGAPARPTHPTPPCARRAHYIQVNATSLIHLYYTAWSTDLAICMRVSATLEQHYHSLSMYVARERAASAS